MSKNKQLSNAFSTGGGGNVFETCVQASYVALMLTGGYAPCLPCFPIDEIRLQVRNEGFYIDDFMVLIRKPGKPDRPKLLCQVKHNIQMLESDKDFVEVLSSAWVDFNNSAKFNKETDEIALITNSLTRSDSESVIRLLEWARQIKDEQTFFRDVELANFSDSGKRKKLEVFRNILTKANDNNEITEKDFYSFLKHFHVLIYDLSTETGVVLSLLQSHIAQYATDPSTAWARILNVVQISNYNAGSLKVENIPNDVKEFFTQKKEITKIPNDVVDEKKSYSIEALDKSFITNEIAIASLLGAWDENSPGDLNAIEKLTNKAYGVWIESIRCLIQQYKDLIKLSNGKWEVINRDALWKLTAGILFDDHLDRFQKNAIEILSEVDPKFELPINERWFANIKGKTLKYSHALRKGIAESLAIIGNRFDDLKNCNKGKARRLSSNVICTLFKDSTWLTWASLDELIPFLAEAAPNELINAIETDLQKSPSPFYLIFNQESSGISGTNYLTGVLWALEKLAWFEDYFSRVSILLGNLASIDPGGNWTNRPINSLTSIFFPGNPQTLASSEKRRYVLININSENPNIAWKLILNLLPNRNRLILATQKPVWNLKSPSVDANTTTREIYYSNVSSLVDLAIGVAGKDSKKLADLVDCLSELPKRDFDKITQIFLSDEILNMSEEERFPIWTKIKYLAMQHKRFAKANWAMNQERISTIENIEEKISPRNPILGEQRLFTDRVFDLYEENDDYKKNQEKLEVRREEAVKKILDNVGMGSIFDFVETVESPYHVGYSLGGIAKQGIEDILLPRFLISEDKKIEQFLKGFIWRRYRVGGIVWLDKLSISNWSSHEKAVLLCSLPFSEEVWSRVHSWLKDEECEYWEKVYANPYDSNDDHSFAIDKLIEFGRPFAAIGCIKKENFDKKPFDTNRATKALISAIESKEPSSNMDVYEVTEIIKCLQNQTNVNQEELERIEWAYLPLLSTYSGAHPIRLFKRLASDPIYFNRIISLAYRSRKKDSKVQNEIKQDFATNSIRLLNEWKIPPGMQDDNTFNREQFQNWVARTKEIATETGHLEVSLIHLGQVLFYSPRDPDGLWIDSSIAKVINSKDGKEIRNGYDTEAFNSRGAHTIDPTGKPEMELAEEYRRKADEIENAGFQRFATTLRMIAEDYDLEAKRIISEHEE